MAYSNTEKRRLWARDHYAKNPEKVKQINKVKREKSGLPGPRKIRDFKNSCWCGWDLTPTEFLISS